MPVFTGGTLNYVLTLSPGNTTVGFTTTAANKNYMVRTYLNTKSGDNWYRRGEGIAVKPGDVINIGIGDTSWPSMNNQGTEAIPYTGTWYSVTIIDSGSADVVKNMISSLPIITYANYKTQADQVALAHSAYEALNADAQKQVQDAGYMTKLAAKEKDIQFFKEIDNVKSLLAAVPAVNKLTIADKSKVVTASDAYKALKPEQQKYITVGDVVKYNAAVEWLKKQGVDTPAIIVGSDKEPGGNAVITPQVTAVNGTAAVSMDSVELTEAITDVKDSGSTVIVIAPEITGTAKKVTVELPKTFLSSAASETDADLTVETHVGSMTIPNDVLATIASQASGSAVTMSLESVAPSTLTAAQQKVASGKPVYDISILSGGNHISSFGGGNITISLPYTLNDGENPEGVTVWYLDDSGKLQEMMATYDKATGLATFKTTHLSYYAVGYDAWTNPFSDVKSTDWFYSAVKFANQNELFEGTTATTFAPSTLMTRAMLAAVLYRLESKPAVTGSNSFKDVKSGQWYTDAVIWANTSGIVNGYGGGLFGTSDEVTREQMAVIMYNYAKYKGYDVTKTADLKAYTDRAGISSWALAAMQWANAEEFITGRTTTTIVPGGASSRAEVASFLMRFMERFKE
jgi:hypothetical protein